MKQQKATARVATTSPNRVILATATGNFVEWFDFSIYGFTIVTLGSVFFPPEEGDSGLIAALAVYGVAFFGRPAGALFFGWFGDRMGRRAALSLSIIVMGASTAAVGLLPGWAAIGVAAPVSLLICRLVQGFSAGGEYSGALTFIVEHAPEHRRGLWVGLIGMSTMAGPTVATLTVFGAEHISGSHFIDWGWRMPFILGGLVSLVGLILRHSVAESPAFEEHRSSITGERHPISELFRDHWRELLVLLVYFGVVGILTHMFIGYMPTYLSTVAGLSSQTALAIMTVVTFLLMGASPLAGWLINKVGRRVVLRIGLVGATIAIVPSYLLIGTGNLLAIGIGLLVFFIPIALISASTLAVLEMLPTSVRFSGVGLPYNVAYAVFAGTAPLVSQSLIDMSGNSLAPAIYGAGAAALALVLLWARIPETRGADLSVGVGIHGTPPPAST